MNEEIVKELGQVADEILTTTEPITPQRLDAWGGSFQRMALLLRKQQAAPPPETAEEETPRLALKFCKWAGRFPKMGDQPICPHCRLPSGHVLVQGYNPGGLGFRCRRCETAFELRESPGAALTVDAVLEVLAEKRLYGWRVEPVPLNGGHGFRALKPYAATKYAPIPLLAVLRALDVAGVMDGEG